MAKTEIFVDSNVILDIVTDDDVWLAWSLGQLSRFTLGERLIIDDIVFAEISSRYPTIEELEELVEGMGLVVEPLPRAALFLAGHAFKLYRDRGGTRDGILPDFLIGAHAAVTGRTLLTRDRGRFRSYFPDLELITP